MSKVRVQLWGKPQGYATVDPAATEGATLGVNLFWPNGTLVVPDDLAPTSTGSDEAGGDGQPSGDPSLWELIVNVPANVQAVAGLSTAGFVRRDGAGAWSASPIVNADLSGANTSGLSEGTNLYYTNARADARVAIGIAAHEAAADPHPQYLRKTVSLTASGAISALRAVVADDGNARYPNMAVAGDVAAVAGISVTSAASGGQVSVLTAGPWTDAGWSWMPGPVFAGASGVLTQTPPIGAVLMVGRALDATTLMVGVQLPLLRN